MMNQAAWMALAGGITPVALGKVVVIMGGHSGEREISLMSGKGVLDALYSVGVDAIAFDPATQALSELQNAKADRAFVCLHGRLGEDGCIQGVLETLKLPYTGSSVMASSIAMDKIMTKRLWLADGLSTPQYRWVKTATQLAQAFDALGQNIAVKPVREGSSLGFSHVQKASELETAWAKSMQIADEVLVEQFIDGRELTVAVMQVDGQTVALPIVEICAPEGNYDYENKYFKGNTQYVCPAQLPVDLTEQIARLAERAFDSVGCAGWGRVDVMLSNQSEQPYLLEINTAPGMTARSSVPMAGKAMGISYPQLCCLIAAGASLKA